MKNKIILIVFVSLMIILPSFAENVLIEADKQTFNNNVTNFEGNVKVDFENITVTSPKAKITSKNGKLNVALFEDGAHAIKTQANSKHDVKAEIIKLSLLEKKVAAYGDSKSILYKDKNPIVTIEADSQEFNIKDNKILAIGNVNIIYNDINTNSQKANIIMTKESKPKKVILIGNVSIVQDNMRVEGSKITFNPINNEMIAQKNAYSETITEDGSKVKIWSDFQHYNKRKNTYITSGHVKIAFKDYVAYGPKATFLPDASGKPNKIVFLGRGKITQGSRQVEADRIEITVKPQNFIAEGNVKTRITDVTGFNDTKKKGK